MDKREYEYISEGFLHNIDFFTPIQTKEDLNKQENEVLKREDLDNDEDLKKLLVEEIRLLTGRIKITETEIIIKGIDFQKFLYRVKRYYKENNFGRILLKNYTRKAEKLWEKKKIAKKDMPIKHLSFPLFFALEISMIFDDLGNYFNIAYYKKMAKIIREKTWVDKMYNSIEDVGISTSNLNNIVYTLKPYQEEFVKLYPTLKYRFNLEGYLLSFDQGLGKTLTSLALAECLNKEQVIIVCPNSLKENWAFEIKSYFKKYKNNDRLWYKEVFVSGNNKYHYDRNMNKYLIVNHEAISKIYPYIMKTNKDTMIIVDECHYFRNMDGKRSNDLIKLKELTSCKDNLMMSGTPIKAIPNEIIPTLRMIDPLFTEEIAKIYKNCFNVDGIGTKNIVNSRFGMVMHRKMKNDVLSLPKKLEYTLRFRCKNHDRFLSNNVSEEIRNRFEELYELEAKRTGELRSTYMSLVKQYARCSRKDLNEYIGFIKEPYKGYHELDEERFKNFPKQYIYPFLDSHELKKFKDAETGYLRIKERAMGRAIGEILPKRKNELYIQLYENNKPKILEMITENPRKTVIFSTMRNVINHIEKSLNDEGIGNVKIIGGTEDRMDKIMKFKNSDEIDVILATISSLSTGVTLTEADQLFFFGKDYRATNNRQAEDRIYRIGQTVDVSIYDILLDTGKELNLSTRDDAITRWSGEMFDNMIGDE